MSFIKRIILIRPNTYLAFLPSLLILAEDVGRTKKLRKLQKPRVPQHLVVDIFRDILSMKSLLRAFSV